MGTTGGAAGQFFGTEGVAVVGSGSGDVYVADLYNTRIDEYAPEMVTIRPSNTHPPSILSRGKVGQRVTCKPGTWTGLPSSFAFTWMIDTSSISSQHAHTYKLAAGDAGTRSAVL